MAERVAVPDPERPVQRLELPDPQATEALGQRLASGLGPPGVIFLSGDLGAGKSTLVRSVLRALGHAGPVPSPTYTLLESYELAGMRCIHCDFYRIGDVQEIEYLGLQEMMDPATLVLIEWPEHGANDLFSPDLEIRLAYSGHARSAELVAASAHGRQWLRTVLDSSLNK